MLIKFQTLFKHFPKPTIFFNNKSVTLNLFLFFNQTIPQTDRLRLSNDQIWSCGEIHLKKIRNKQLTESTW